LSDGFSGVLLVGAGGNDVDNAIEVGTFEAELTGNTLTVTYHLYATYDLSEVHVYAACTTPGACSPGSYTYPGPGGSQPNLTGTTDRDFSVDIAVSPECDSYYLIFHAKVSQIRSSPCPSTVQ